MAITFLILKGFFLSHRAIEDSILYMSRAGYHYSYQDWYTMPNSRFKKHYDAAVRYYKRKAEQDKNNIDLEDEED